MIVPSMNLDEIKKEIEKDVEILLRKSYFVGRQLEREYRLKGSERKQISFDYYSKYKNTWVYAFDMTKNNTICSFIVYYYADRGLNAFLKLREADSYVFFSAHFFKRYNERLKLNLIVPKDIVHAFMISTNNFIFHKIERIDNHRHKFFCLFKSGIGLGTMDAETKVYKMNTFLSKDMLKGDQHELEADLKMQLEKYVKDSRTLD